MENASSQPTSPNNWNRAFSPRNTPAVVGPEFKPIRIAKLDVPYSIYEIDSWQILAK
jgi:hypothetical protein